MPARSNRHRERHRQNRVGWLRASVLGANDAIVSTSALLMGVTASGADSKTLLVAGTAGLVGGAMSMAVGEYVSVSSQSDAEDADIAQERSELENQPADELRELTGLYVKRGLSEELARQVAEALTQKDALGAHLKDELGIEEHTRARPLLAAMASALSFAIFALVPLLAALLAPTSTRTIVIGCVSLLSLAGSGILAARLGGAPALRPALRVTIGGAVAMGLGALVGRLL